MAPVTDSIQIARPPEDVFAYIADLSRHGEWQSQIQEIKVQTEGPTRVGTPAVGSGGTTSGGSAPYGEVSSCRPVDNCIRFVGILSPS